MLYYLCRPKRRGLLQCQLERSFHGSRHFHNFGRRQSPNFTVVIVTVRVRVTVGPAKLTSLWIPVSPSPAWKGFIPNKRTGNSFYSWTKILLKNWLPLTAGAKNTSNARKSRLYLVFLPNLATFSAKQNSTLVAGVSEIQELRFSDPSSSRTESLRHLFARTLWCIHGNRK